MTAKFLTQLFSEKFLNAYGPTKVGFQMLIHTFPMKNKQKKKKEKENIDNYSFWNFAECDLKVTQLRMPRKIIR